MKVRHHIEDMQTENEVITLCEEDDKDVAGVARGRDDDAVSVAIDHDNDGLPMHVLRRTDRAHTVLSTYARATPRPVLT
eukprot:3507832-Rhodomonas_salina.3